MSKVTLVYDIPLIPIQVLNKIRSTVVSLYFYGVVECTW